MLQQMFQHDSYKCSYVLVNLKFRALPVRERHFEALVLRKLYNGFNCLIIAIGVRVPVRNTEILTHFKVRFQRKKIPSVRCALAANGIYNNVYMFHSHFFNIILLVNLVTN